jgi:hypothetical protein
MGNAGRGTFPSKTLPSEPLPGIKENKNENKTPKIK